VEHRRVDVIVDIPALHVLQSVRRWSAVAKLVYIRTVAGGTNLLT
jgi:hypothetical protein